MSRFLTRLLKLPNLWMQQKNKPCKTSEFGILTCVLMVMWIVGWTTIGFAQGFGQNSINTKGPNALTVPLTSGIVGSTSYPLPEYRSAFMLIADGNLKDASDAFESFGKRSYKTGNARWIDSICYATMLGECWYEAGQNLKALACYEDALQLAIDYNGWMSRLNYDAAQMPQPRSSVSPAPWGVSRTPGIPAKYGNVQIARGNPDTEAAFEQGGVLELAHYLVLQPHEICYATTLATMRRYELLGAVAKFDPMNQRILKAVENSGCPRNHWMIAWADAQQGAALIAAGKDDEAEKVLSRCTLVAGQYLHPLSGLVYTMLGGIAERRGNIAAAINCYQEATYAAYPYEDPIVLQMAFGRLAAIGVATGKPVLLVEGLAWTRGAGTPQKAKGGRDFNTLRVILSLAAAEVSLGGGRADEAAKFLTEAGTILTRRTIGLGPLGIRHQFLLATLAYHTGNTVDGDKALAGALLKNVRQSLSLFHLQLVLNYSKTNSTATARRQVELYRELLTDPSPADWLNDPLEALTMLSMVDETAYLNFFVATQNLSDQNAAIGDTFEVSEQIRRRRFFAALDSRPAGARLFSLRMLLESDPQMLTVEERKSRQAVLALLPDWDASSRRAAELKRQIASEGLGDLDDANATARSAAAGELAKISKAQEIMLQSIALRRIYAPLTFPPQRTLKEIQMGMADGTAMLTYIGMGRRYYAFLFNKDRITMWDVKNTAAIQRATAAYFKSLGLLDPKKAIDVKDLQKQEWEKAAADLAQTVMAGSQFDPTTDFQELVIVPDGLFWYVPFEAFHLDFGNKKLEPLVAYRRVRYAPTAALGMADDRSMNPHPTTFVVTGKMDSGTEVLAPTKIFDRINDAVPDAIRLTKAPMPEPVITYKQALQRLIVWHDVANNPADPGTLVPTGFGGGKPGSTLIEWLLLPWGGPDFVALPGFHSPAENGLKTLPAWAGREFFLTSCAMMATGTRTIVLSRWKMGGSSTGMLMQELLRETPATTASEAWQRAVLLMRESKLKLVEEPKVQLSPNDDQTISGSHPLFWSGYLVIDRGTSVAEPIDTKNANGANAPGANGVAVGANPAGGMGGADAADANANADTEKNAEAGTEVTPNADAAEPDTNTAGADNTTEKSDADDSPEAETKEGDGTDDAERPTPPKPARTTGERPFTSPKEEDTPESYEDNVTEELDAEN